MLLLESPVLERLLGASSFAQIAVSLFLAILFLQSGFDKVLDFKGNLEWLKGHFVNSPLAGLVRPMLGVITLIEVAAGLCALIGMVMLLWNGTSEWALIGAQLAGLNIIMLFFGQRMAKDYEGAASLSSYFVIVLFALFLLS